MVVNDLRFGRADSVGEVGEGLDLDLFDGAEAEKEVAGGLGADAGDVGEGGAEGAFGAFVAVEGDGKAVNLVLYLFEEVDKRVGRFELNDFYSSPRFAEIMEILEIII